jgi:hypothetical protein
MHANQTDEILVDCNVSLVETLVNSTWEKDNIDLPDEERFHFMFNQTVLRIDGLELRDTGTFKCTVENETSIFIKETQLKVHVKNVNYEAKHLLVGVARTRNAVLNGAWWIVNHPIYAAKPDANYTVKWFVNSRLIDLRRPTDKYEFSNSNKTLKINNIRITDPVSYTCFLYLNNFDVKISNFTLDIGGLCFNHLALFVKKTPIYFYLKRFQDFPRVHQ